MPYITKEIKSYKSIINYEVEVPPEPTTNYFGIQPLEEDCKLTGPHFYCDADSSISFEQYYSDDYGETWQELPKWNSSDPVTMTVGRKYYFKGSVNYTVGSGSCDKHGVFAYMPKVWPATDESFTTSHRAKVNIGGNIFSFIDTELTGEFSNNYGPNIYNYSYGLLALTDSSYNPYIISAENLVLDDLIKNGKCGGHGSAQYSFFYTWAPTYKLFLGQSALTTPPSKITIYEPRTYDGDYYDKSFLSETFRGCTSLTSAPEIDIQGSTSGTLYMNSMFYGCSALQSPPVLTGLTGRVTGLYAQYTFENCTALTEPMSGQVLSNMVRNNFNVYSIYEGCTALEKVPVEGSSGSGSYYSYNLLGRAFYNCSKLKFSRSSSYGTLAISNNGSYQGYVTIGTSGDCTGSLQSYMHELYTSNETV